VTITPRKTKTRAKLEQTVVLSMVSLVFEIGNIMSILLQKHGLSLVQFNVLRILRGADGDGLPCGVIAERLINRDPDITRLLDRMEKLELIVRSRNHVDRRVVLARITEHGLGILAKLDEPHDALYRQLFAHLSSTKLEAMAQLIQDIRNRPE
jgi:DNA-binding MarR family transcriptional regulator